MLDDDLANRRKRALYRANHRGTKELDFLLGRFADTQLATMDALTLARFEAFLALNDPDLHGWILQPDVQAEPIADEFVGLIDKIRAYHGV